jgi:hypothetical protein
MSLSINTKAIKLFESQLRAYKERAIPFATKAAVNSYAYETQKRAKEIIREKMILRNKFTERSIRVQKTTVLIIDEQKSRVGSTQEYMRGQEVGATKIKRGKHGVLLPTSFSAGQADSTKPRTKLPRKRFAMNTIVIQKQRNHWKSKKQANAVAIKQALQRGNQFIYLELGTKRGIFYIQGNARTKKINKLKMLYDLSRPAIRIPVHKWLEPATNYTKSKMHKIYFKALRFQLERHNLLKKL